MEELPKKYVHIYRFEPVTGIHCDTAIAEYTSETPNLDPNWTTIAPTTPPKEYVCVFKNGQWTHEKKDKFNFSTDEYFYGIYLHEDGQKLTAPSVFPTGTSVNADDSKFDLIKKYYQKINGFDRYTHSYSGAVSMYHRLFFLNQRLSELYQDYPDLSNLKDCQEIASDLNFSDLFNRRYEEIIYHMKRILDVLVMISCIEEKLKEQTANATFEIKVDSIGDLFDSRKDHLTENIKKSLAFSHFSEFYKYINSLHNCFKHEILCEKSSENLYFLPFIDIRKKQKPGSFASLIIYRCSFDYIVNAFRDVLSEIIIGIPQPSKFEIHKTKEPLPPTRTPEEEIKMLEILKKLSY